MVTKFDIDKQFGKYKDKKITRAKAIKLYCKELCCAGDNVSWRECSFVSCPLWRFRKGSEFKGNSGSFGVRKDNSTQKELSLKNSGKIGGFVAKNEDKGGVRDGI